MSVEELPKPEPKDGEVLLRMEAVGICGSDVHGFTGESGRRAPGMVMGHEAVGQVVAHGSGVTDPEIGSRVTVYNVLSDVAPTPDRVSAQTQLALLSPAGLPCVSCRAKSLF